MKQKFVNATMNDRRKGKECLTHTTQFNPNHPTALIHPDSAVALHRSLPAKALKPKKEEPLSDLEAMKMELLKAMRAVEKAPRSVPKSKLIGMANASAKEDPARDYNDILAMLLAKK